MASQSRKAAAIKSGNEEGILARVSQSTVVYHGKKAASNSHRYLGTSFLVLAVPFFITYDREQQITEMEMQNASLLGTPPAK
ncbi:hypothetical protein MKW94_027999 [Papaver nudicaule]|uniref:Uncharacterized protein n=1 Tax=Papaver nudicaule TaxID=74823 RepID=A0AA41VCD1_PAPNU|nr:hypothetical protein [Papaver nudicaule]